MGRQIKDVAYEWEWLWTRRFGQSWSAFSGQVDVGRDDADERNQGVGDSHLFEGAEGQESEREEKRWDA